MKRPPKYITVLVVTDRKTRDIVGINSDVPKTAKERQELITRLIIRNTGLEYDWARYERCYA